MKAVRGITANVDEDPHSAGPDVLADAAEIRQRKLRKLLG
jgi:hypothetical protein